VRYFVSFAHKLLPTGKIEFQNGVLNLDEGEVFDVREFEKMIMEKSGLQDVSIISFQLLTHGEK
jgi:hypothetical protein